MSRPTTFEFADSYDREVYANWHVPLLERLFGDSLDFHWDLYELTHLHRREHNGGADEGSCSAWPSPPYRAPVWQIVAEKTGAGRWLEVGTALGYATALMADAGGPDCHVDTIEIDSGHADIAEAELARLGLSDRVRVLRGDAKDVLKDLDEPYDVVFSDGGRTSEISQELYRLTLRGGVDEGIVDRLFEPLNGVLTELQTSLAEGGREPEMDSLSEARRDYRSGVGDAL